MTTSDEYQRFADECMGWARGAKTEAERKAFLDMARAWMQAAAKMNDIPINVADDPGAERPAN
jgi:hypothetical protein